MAIKSPRVYKHESLPSSPSWNDVKVILNTAKTDYPTDILVSQVDMPPSF
jgi:hypothetical protein